MFIRTRAPRRSDGGDDSDPPLPFHASSPSSAALPPPADPLAGRKPTSINRICRAGRRRGSAPFDSLGGGSQLFGGPPHDASRRRSVVEVAVLVIVLAALSLAFPNRRGTTGRDGGGGGRSDGVVSFACPSSVPKSLNDVGDAFDVYTDDIHNHHLRNNATGKFPGLEQIRSRPMDGWEIPYPSVKELLRPWKEEAIVPNLRSGDAVYESACGAGLNLLLTAEIAAERGVRNLTVYGNDYLAESAAVAGRMWSGAVASDGGPPLPARGGTFCVGDSSDLRFVPSSSFDLAYAGYIDPISDPLNILQDGATIDERRRNSVRNCFAADPEKAKLAKEEQRKQEEWHSAWVKELIRIVKPGKVVSIESICESLCKHYREQPQVQDWGGVDKEWWEEAIRKYGWDVEPGSLLIKDAPVTNEWKYIRYHVMMRKKMQ